jgi:cysteine desulfurase / selenocysteine lyase
VTESAVRSGVSSGALDVEAIRADFPFFDTGVIYLDSANTAQRPRQVLGAMNEYFTKFNANIHRAPYRVSEEATAHYEATREKVRAFLNAASRKEIVYTRSTTEAINLVAYSWGRSNIKPGDLIVLTITEHHSNLVPWQLLAQEKGARIEYVDIDEQGRLRLDQFHRLLEKRPKLVAFPQISNTLGTINPFREMTEAAHRAGAVVLIDGAQGAAHMGIDVHDAGCDFYAFSSHKMCGPTGVGVLWGRRELLEAMQPFNLGGEMIRSVSLERTSWNELPYKFEAGTPAIAEAYGFGIAIDYVSAVGLEAIERHEHELVVKAMDALAEIPGIRIFGPPADRRTGIVSFELEGVHPHDVAQILNWEGVAVRAGHHCTQPLMTRLGVAATTRASFYLYSLPDDVDRLIAGLHKVKETFGV